MTRVRSLVQDAAGALVVEMALVLPLVLLMTIGTVEVALYMHQANAAEKATALGARWAAVNRPVSATLRSAISDTSWWNVGTLGESCDTTADGCFPGKGDVYTCQGGATGCTMSEVVTLMQRSFPNLKDTEVTIRYEGFDPDTSHALGFVGKPGGPPMRITVSICRPFQFAFLSAFVGAFPNPDAPAACPAGSPKGFYTTAQAYLTSESMCKFRTDPDVPELGECPSGVGF